MTDHAKLEAQILDYLRLCGWKAWKTHNGKHRPADPGIPDIMGIRGGLLLAVEVKAGKDTLREEQNSFLRELIDAGAAICIARSLEDVTDRIGRVKG
jgi:Holliday junction resolvase